MKRSLLIFAAIGALFTLASCNKDIEPDSGLKPQAEAGFGILEISVKGENAPMTKAVSAYTTAQTYESQANSIQVFVFDEAGDLNFYKDLGSTTSASINTTQGAKTVWAVVNGPDMSDIKSMSALKAKAVDLADNSITAAEGFVMSGSNTCNVTASGATCAVTVKRLAARVALVSVKNDLPASYGALKIERVWLSNVVGNQNIEGAASPATWYNKEGRADEATRNAAHIIDGSTYKASCPDLTFKSVGQSIANGASYAPSTPDLFYTYANTATTAPDGFKSTFAAQRSVLVVAATVNSQLYYYPVILDSGVISRNTAHTVALTITGLGSDDPNKPVEKGGLNISISVAGWEAGATYEETI